ncbi:MAG: LysM peptidoglycan-binding domain-containing protein, partial [Promethearchaeia archaeon]
QSAQTSATLSCSQRFYTAPFHGHAAQYCIDIYVQRCKYCMRAGDSLEGVARAWKTSVAQLWSGNPHLLQPNLLEIGTLLNVGVVYTVDVDDRLPLLAQMAGRSVKDLVAWNPDLPSENQDLLAGDEVLRSAASLYHPGEAPWAGLHGTVANSQAVCVLPDICTFAPLPQSEFVDIEAATDAVRNATVKISTESFSCSTCRKGSEFCTGAICVEGSNGDPGPWSRDQCKTWRGTRCEQCASCREEEFDVDGHIVVHGTFRRFLRALDRE